MENFSVSRISSDFNGGGCYLSESKLSFADVSITNNTGKHRGGGLYITDDGGTTFSSELRCNIHSNALLNGSNGVDLYLSGGGEVTIDTFSVMSPTSYYAAPLADLEFDILNAVNSISNMDIKKSKTIEKKDYSNKADVLTLNNQVKSDKSEILVLNQMIE